MLPCPLRVLETRLTLRAPTANKQRRHVIGVFAIRRKPQLRVMPRTRRIFQRHAHNAIVIINDPVRFRNVRVALVPRLSLSPSDRTTMFIPVAIDMPAQTPVSQVRYQDSNHEIWETVPKWIRELAECIRQHESRHNYRAENGGPHGGSSAAGAYQFLQGTWTGNAKWVRIAKPYAHKPASHAPKYVQDAVFIHSIKHGGIKNWNGTYCPGT